MNEHKVMNCQQRITQEAQAFIQAASVETLVAVYDKTNGVTIKGQIERDWILDELEKRDPDSFRSWWKSDDESPRQFFAQTQGQDVPHEP